MYHDRILLGINKCLEAYLEIYGDGRTSTGVDVKNINTLDLQRYQKYEGEYEHIVGVMDEMTGGDEAVFYFDNIADAKDLLDTGIEFYQNGLLSAPFDKGMFILNDDEGVAMCVWFNKIDDSSYRIVSFCEDPSRTGYSKVEMWPECDFILRRDFQNELTSGCSIQCNMLFSPRGDTDYDMQITKESAMLHICGFLQGCMQLYMPHFEKQKYDISEKVNKKRIKKGKEPYKGYTYVKMRSDIKESIAREGENISGYTVRPHWRRGHIRTLKDGRKIPVRPCMINWEGDADLEKNVYFVLDKETV